MAFFSPTWGSNCLKVAAHGRCKNQNLDLSEGNRKADELAKACADQLFKDKLDDLTCKIAWVLDLQSHLIRQFCQNSSSAMLQEYGLDAECAEPSDVKVSPAQNCTCAPLKRIRKKRQVLGLCRGACARSLQTATVERALLNLLDRRAEIPNSMWALLGDRYPVFKGWISARSDRVMPADVSHVVAPRQRKLPHRLKNIIVSSIHDSHWGKASGFLSGHTPWAFFMIDIISEHGFVPGVFDVGQSFGLLIERFKCYWKHFLRPAFPTLEDDYNATKHCTCFGLSTLSACPLHLKLRNPKALWSILIQASLYCNKEPTGFRNCRSHWVPDWNLV